MRTTTISAILVLVVCTINLSNAAPMETAWTYQGRLMDDNNPGEGVFDFQFKLFDAPYTGNQQGSTVDVSNLDVIDGYFTAELDFGSDVFDSDAYWLEIDVRPGGTVDPFITLSPRQEITPTPYAMQTRGIFVDDIPYIVDYPDTWTPKESDRTWRSVAMSADGTKQTAVGNNLQIYVSTDSGNTWTPKESYRWWYSVAISADGTIQTAVAYAEQIYVSTDSGNTWTAKESNRYWRSVAMSEDGTKQTAVGLQGQIYVSTDSGNTWAAKESNRDWYSVAMSADGTKQTAVGQNTQIYVSTDSGNTWTAKESNRNWWSVAMSADGAKQTAVVVGGQIYVSMDSGNTWTAKELNRNWYSVTMSADGTKQTAVVTGGQIYVSMDAGNTWTAKESNREWYSVAMSADGIKQTAVVDQGQIYICSADMSYSYNVGIGTMSPEAKLDVRGNLYVEGKVGIGTTNPDPFPGLHIAGSDVATGLLLENLQATSAWYVLSDNEGTFYITESPGSGGWTRFRINPGGDTELVPAGGNVGIGILTPTEKLEVAGTIKGINDAGIGVYGVSDNTTGVYGEGSGSGKAGVYGFNSNGYGVHGKSSISYGVYGESDNTTGIYGKGSGSGKAGVYGFNSNGYGVHGESSSSYGVYGISNSTTGIYGKGAGVDKAGVFGINLDNNGFGVHGYSPSGIGVLGNSTDGFGVRGTSETNRGVYGYSTEDIGVIGYSPSGIGVCGKSDANDQAAVYALNTNPTGNAGYFYGNVTVTGLMSKGGGSFKIDHPLDPENKYLQHSFVESPDMMNVYNGNVILDENGRAEVRLPEYFEALNCDFRYQLTCIGGFAQVYIAEEISDNRFKIAGGRAGLKVSWQVTGIRQDPYAVANRIEIEENKPDEERGYYLHPNAYSLPDEKSIEMVRNPRLLRTQEVTIKEMCNESDKHYN